MQLIRQMISLNGDLRLLHCTVWREQSSRPHGCTDEEQDGEDLQVLRKSSLIAEADVHRHLQ